jgi:hypothetical protein
MTTKIKMSAPAEQLLKANAIAEGTPLIAEMATKLEASLVVASPTVSKRNIDPNFGEKMDTIKVAVPSASTVATHSDSGNSATDFVQRYRNITLDKIYTVDHEFTAEQWNLLIKTGGSEVLDSMIHGLSEQIESYCLEIYAKYAKSYDGTPGTTMTAYTSVIGARKRMNIEKAPMNDRNLVVDSTTAGAMLGLDQWDSINVSGDTPALREASLGRRAGMNIWESQFVWDTTAASTFEAVNQTMAVTCDVSAANSVDTTTGLEYSAITVTEAGTASSAIVSLGAQGYLTDDNGVVHYFTCIEASSAASSGVVTCKVYPALPTDCTGTVLVWACKNKTTNTRNLLIQKDCVTLAAKALEPYPDRFSVSTSSTTGIPLRFSMGSTLNTKKIWCSLDCLIKAVVLRPEGVTTFYG